MFTKKSAVLVFGFLVFSISTIQWIRQKYHFYLILIVKFFFTKRIQNFGLIQWNDYILVSKRKKNKTRWNKSAMKYVKYVIKNVMDIPYWLVCRLKKNQMEGPFIWYPITHYTTPTPSCDMMQSNISACSLYNRYH